MLGLAGNDFEWMRRELLPRIAGDSADMQQKWDELWTCTEEFVKEPKTWRRIESVAEALLEEIEFGRKRIYELVREADGSP